MLEDEKRYIEAEENYKEVEELRAFCEKYKVKEWDI